MNVIFPDCARLLGKLERIINERALSSVKRRGGRITLKGCEQFVVFGECTESLPVMAYSIVAVINNRNRDCDHLALSSR